MTPISFQQYIEYGTEDGLMSIQHMLQKVQFYFVCRGFEPLLSTSYITRRVPFCDEICALRKHSQYITALAF
jgi:hypothetical protein